MMEQHKLMDEFQKRVRDLNTKAQNIAHNMFLFDEYHPKRIPEGICNDEIAFWYLIIDLYGLFHDAGKYILDIPEWDHSDQSTIKAFYDALNEMRSIICHNKPPSTYLPLLITDNFKLKRLVTDWWNRSQPIKKILNADSKATMPYRELFDLFLEVANKVLILIDEKILCKFDYYVKNNQNDEIYTNWFIPIFNWYWDNTIIYVRAWNSYCRMMPNGNINNFETQSKAKHIGEQLKLWLINNACCSPKQVAQFGKNMYYNHFSLSASTAARLNLTPYTLYHLLLKDYYNRIPPNKNLFTEKIV